MAKKSKKQRPKKRIPRSLISIALFLLMLIIFYSFTNYESYASLYDAEYVGSEKCGDCHTISYDKWAISPHANMTRKPSSESVVGNFNDGSWTLPISSQKLPSDSEPAAKMYQENGAYYISLRHPETGQFVPFKIDYVIGYQYRQTYLTREEGGVLRRLPLQWSVPRQEFFPYWNEQEQSTPSIADLWAQLTSLNSAWNLFCARCHTTALDIISKDQHHTQANTEWVDDGIGCEACHGPGSQHVNYFATNYINRLAAFANSKIRNQPVAYIANGPKLNKGEDLSVCARCHGPDISISTTEIYRVYEPGYTQDGHINDLSPFFQMMPLQPGRTAPTVEVWANGRPKGIGMLFRSFIESTCYEKAETRCYDCHDPHNNKAPTEPGLLTPSEASNQYCLDCHPSVEVADHTKHEPQTEGSFCYDCHMPRDILNLVTGVPKMTRSHTMSAIPDPRFTEQLGYDQAPNACNECHTDQTAGWAVAQMNRWWPKK